MNIEDIEEVIKELKNAKADLYEANNRIVDLMNIIDERDKIIDEMAKFLIGFPVTAYEKEKEKNKEEYDKGYKEGLIKGLEPQILDNWNKENARIVNIKSQYISKDKIKTKIEELNNGTYDAKIVLQSLLDKE